ncbi:unnamed protein product [Ixodes pacificus]
MAQQLLERALVDARAEMEAKKHNDSTSRPSSSPTNVVDGEASRLAGEILSAAVSATAQTLREAPHREERATSDKRPPTGQLPQQQHDPPETQQQRHHQSPSAARRLLTSARDKAHFLGDPATSPEPALREVLGAGLSSTKRPSEPRCAEIVVHEMDDELSEAGSEDVELLGHRYETAAPRSSVRGESLATELRRCREPSPGDSGVQSQESGDEAAVSARGPRRPPFRAFLLGCPTPTTKPASSDVSCYLFDIGGRYRKICLGVHPSHPLSPSWNCDPLYWSSLKLREICAEIHPSYFGNFPVCCSGQGRLAINSVVAVSSNDSLLKE